MATASTAPSIRDLMPKGHLPKLCKQNGTANLSYMSQVVNLENDRAAAWPLVLAMAEANDPEGYAQWAAANPDKLPKVAA